ncbi:MAG: ABC transporter ATP-binding protein [Bacteroidetes bacterium]|nr:ABC transporter ATP-binding protein [Fibrella sp.]
MLDVHKITKSFADGPPAVKNVSFTLDAGQIMGLVGASGSGKSTLLSLLAGLTDADSGQVRLNGERVAGPAEVLVPGRPDIQLVHQDYQLMPNVSIRENITYAVRFYDAAYQTFRVDELVRICRLELVQHRLPRQVSGGEKQRTAIARAVALKPALLLLDEPFSHLDLPNRTIIRDMLLDLVATDQTACLFVTHDATDALSIAHTLGVLQAGQLVQLAPPVDVYRRPLTAEAARLTGPVNILKAKHLSALNISVPLHPSATCCLRPEQIQWREADGIPALVRAVFFRGNQFEIEVDVSRYVRLRLLTTRDDLLVGQRVGVVVPPDALWWLRG